MKNNLVVKDDIYWVGALDFDIRVFDIVMYTEYGTTYNSYIVKGSDKIALVETAKDKFFDEFLERINTVCQVKDIDYIIVNHTEPDHSGSVAKLLELNPDITVVGSACALKYLKEIANREFKGLAVKDKDTLDLGGKTFEFISAPFLHWPDSMYTYLKEENILFTCDSFGSHFCNENIFNDKIDVDFTDSYKYYFDCIMGPFKSYMVSALNKIEHLKIDMICPGHGPVLRTDIDRYVNLYKDWTKIEKFDNVVVGYVSAYGYTKKIAEKVAEGVKLAGFEPKLYDLENADVAEVLGEVGKAKGILLGSPTIVNDTLPPVWSVLSGLNAVINKGLFAGAFGSYGWTGEGVTHINERFKQLKFNIPLEPLKILFNPSDEQFKMAFDFGKTFAENIK